jgi:hypothetical protein
MTHPAEKPIPHGREGAKRQLIYLLKSKSRKNGEIHFTLNEMVIHTLDYINEVNPVGMFMAACASAGSIHNLAERGPH